MQIKSVSNIPFGYKNVLKGEWLKGHMPSVKIGIYGGKLTKKNVTLEHIIPHSQGGETKLSNLVLAVDENNFKRKTENLRNNLNYEIFKRYLAQFKNVDLPNFNGKKYIKMITETVHGALEQ